jgi:ABC-type Zn uptake system ZnuABC Zn-binding protein ZnuA
VSSDREDTIEVIEKAPAAPRSKRTEISSHPKERIVATKVKALTAKAGERPTTMAATPNHSAHEKAMPTANTQIKVLTDLVKSLLRTMEEQKEEHAYQLEALTKTFTQQIETLKAQVTGMMEKIET